VLYLDDLSPRGELDYLAGGLTESLIHELTQVEALRLVSRNGVKPYRRGTVPLGSVAGRLRVGSIVEGSVQPWGDSVRVRVHLVDAGTPTELDSRVVVRARGEVVALQQAFADEVVGALRRRLGREVRLREVEAETGNARALDAVLRTDQVRPPSSGGSDRSSGPRWCGVIGREPHASSLRPRRTRRPCASPRARAG
jgi:TolB-like protein